MSEFNPAYVKQKLPTAIEDIKQIHLQKMLTACDTIDDLAKQSGAQQFIKDAASFRQAVETNAEYVKKICGEEGDTGTETGSLYGVVTVATKLAIATGGEA